MMTAIPELMLRFGWTQETLALHVAQDASDLSFDVGPSWWQLWPAHLREALSYDSLVYEMQTLPGDGAISFALTAMLAQRQQRALAGKPSCWLMGIEAPGMHFNANALAALEIPSDIFLMGISH